MSSRDGDRRVSAARPPGWRLRRALLALLGGCALSGCGPARPRAVVDRAAVPAPRATGAASDCVARFEAAVAVAEAAGAEHARAVEARAARIAEGRREVEAQADAARRSDAALRRWVISHIALKKLPCELAGADYLVGLRVTSRASAPLGCELDEIGEGLASLTMRKQATVEPGQTAQLDTTVRTCAASGDASARRRFVLTCQLSAASRSEAGIEDARVRSFVYDLDTLELSGAPVPSVDFVPPPAPPPPEPPPEREPFLARCRGSASP